MVLTRGLFKSHDIERMKAITIYGLEYDIDMLPKEVHDYVRQHMVYKKIDKKTCIFGCLLLENDREGIWDGRLFNELSELQSWLALMAEQMKDELEGFKDIDGHPIWGENEILILRNFIVNKSTDEMWFKNPHF